MTKKEIAILLITLYESILISGKKDNKQRFLTRLIKNDLEKGICAYLYRKDLLRSLSKKPKYLYGICDSYGHTYTDTPRSGFFWCKIPRVCNTKKEMIETINFRLKRLRSWIK